VEADRSGSDGADANGNGDDLVDLARETAAA